MLTSRFGWISARAFARTEVSAFVVVGETDLFLTMFTTGALGGGWRL